MSRRTCHYCSAPATTRDHIVPRSKGGKNVGWNIVPACRKCNGTKGNKWPTCQCMICRNAVSRHTLGFIPQARAVGNATDYFEKLMKEMERDRQIDEAIERSKQSRNKEEA